MVLGKPCDVMGIEPARQFCGQCIAHFVAERASPAFAVEHGYAAVSPTYHQL